IEAEYELYDVEPADLEDFFQNLKSKEISGLNVTIPHKIKTKEYLERNGTLDTNARRCGAVNTIKVARDGSLCGYNTDGPGFYRSLVEDLGFEPEDRAVFVLGSGGAARAIVMYLGNGPRRIFISDIDNLKTQALASHYKKYYDEKKIVVVEDAGFKDSLKNSDLFINATPIGMKEPDPSPVDKNLLRPGLRVYDLVYNRPATQLVKEANQLKLHAVTGLGMLLYQGAIAFEIWTGKKAPVDTMKKALKGALKAG
ncbi:MAG: shikimate dehydrogenase, partial [Candidatus Omnitrophica bacterium]|nr:shikimate dehydrogenase [Candidatus Omnitrophota bacterium]